MSAAALRALGLAAAIAFAGAASAEEPAAVAHGIEITDGRIFAAGAGAMSAAAYFRVTNAGETEDRLIGVGSDAAQMVMIHTTETTEGIARMRPVAEPITITPGGALSFEPGGLHVMLMGPTAPFDPENPVGLTLTFEHAGVVEVQLPVETTLTPDPDG